MKSLMSVRGSHRQQVTPRPHAILEIWTKRIWPRVADWLMEPVSFPGKWPDIDCDQPRYNRVKESHPW
jgi:hypothetical protein